ncbi:site-specific recombinase [Flavobacterium sp. HXWNR29]|uniref:site-specific recombinase n=1 Tax=Flavobacterium odoriferum TaxID=2946604 RepID=UPI0021CB4E79|nr:site-specific recombinase [Flavobacterium sp. HXWNR29]MCU4188046.1 site-specific recombinase [Flavobacterium sp. HXWNR29]
MNIARRKNTNTFEEICHTYFNELQLWKNEEYNEDIVVALVNTIRPKKPKTVEVVDISNVLHFFIENPQIKENFVVFLQSILQGRNFDSILTDAGILQDTDFIYEVKKRIFAKILPYQAPKETLQYLLNQIFFLDSDPIWVNKIPKKQLEELFELFGFSGIYEAIDEGSVLFEVMQAMNLLSQRTSGRALESEVLKMVPEYANLESPFAAFEKELFAIENTIKQKENNFHITSSDINYKQLLVLYKQCNEFVEKAFQNSSKYGISLRVNQNLLRIKQQLYRLGVLLPLLVIDKPEEKKTKSIELAIKLIKYNCQKTNVRKLINESTQLLSYEITQHTAKTGEHYITESKTEYFKMLYAALGGGLIVGFLCIFKLLLSKLETSDFGHAFFYSLNYSFGFIVIYLLGFTLATKQPAMTAAALITALEDGLRKNSISADEKHKSFAKLFARLFRSQFIAFVGNVAMAFPVSLLGIWLIDITFHYNIAEVKWNKLLVDLSPIHSMAIFHAAIAGFFLFLSGIISGSISNRDKHFEVKYRIEEHPWLKMTFGKERTKKIANWYDKKWSGVISNFWFGVFLGSTASVGLFLGLNLDIRHITFASGNLALGLYGANYVVSNSMLFWGIFGIGIIGLVNFLVSFGLSLGLAFRSRNIPLTELRPIFSSIKRRFLSKPMSFFFPTE